MIRLPSKKNKQGVIESDTSLIIFQSVYCEQTQVNGF